MQGKRFIIMAENSGNPIIEKLDKNNYPSWKFCVKNFLIGKGLYEFVSGEETEPELSDPPPTADELKARKERNSKDKKVMYRLSAIIDKNMLGHIRNAENSYATWTILKTMFLVNTKARKIQLKQELNTLKKGKMSINDYALRVRSIADSLAANDAMPDDDDLLSSTLGGLNNEKAWKSFFTSVYVRKPFPDFDELVSLMITEEINMQTKSTDKSGEHADEIRRNQQTRVVNRLKPFTRVQEGDVAGSLQEAVVMDVVVITSKIG
ncbi:hypothetical protein L7F22_054967 [Adiantum nelumboides]|nr:hypothetical protein [Adiantum nelumboides]